MRQVVGVTIGLMALGAIALAQAEEIRRLEQQYTDARRSGKGLLSLLSPDYFDVSDEEIGVLRAWIDQGAEMPGRALEAAAVARETEPKVQALLEAIARHDTATVRHVLAADRSLARAADAQGSTTLMHAAYAGTPEIMRALIDAGADLKASNRRRATALHWAAHDPAKLRLLLANGADVNARTVEGRTALHTAAVQPRGAELVCALVEVGADVNTKTITVGPAWLRSMLKSALTR